MEALLSTLNLLLDQIFIKDHLCERSVVGKMRTQAKLKDTHNQAEGEEEKQLASIECLFC